MPSEPDAMPSPAEIEARVTDYVERELLGGRRTIQRDDDLLSGDLLDSMAALRLATWVGREFEFDADPSEFVVENFQTVAILTDYIRRSISKAG
jgi:acyl carrier protein